MKIQNIEKALIERRFIMTTIKWIPTIPSRLLKLCIKIINKADKLIAKEYLHIMARRIPVQNNKIIFLPFRGDYECNVKWICEEIIKQQLPYELRWGIHPKTDNTSGMFPECVKLYTRGSYKFYKELSSARIIIDNGVSTAFLDYIKKPDQILIETWHGAIGIKKFSPNTVNDKNWVKLAYKEAAMTDYCISNSTFEDAVYREDYWKTTPILRYGHARNDILCEKDTKRKQMIRDDIFEKYSLSPETKICMYAPTFRDDKDLRPYLIDYDKLLEALKRRFGGNWVVFTRFHYKVRGKVKHIKLPEEVINVSQYPDIQELMTCVDVGITDYSSWICEYLLTRRPGFLFATDMDHYTEKERDFFYPLSSMPFPLAINNEQLIENIENFDMERFAVECEKFLKDKGCIDDGYASERIVEKIKEIIEKGSTI